MTIRKLSTQASEYYKEWCRAFDEIQHIHRRLQQANRRVLFETPEVVRKRQLIANRLVKAHQKERTAWAKYQEAK